MAKAYEIVLASTSPYRRQLLQQTGLMFSVASPAVDETPLPQETAPALVERLARAKAEAVAQGYKSEADALHVIGSDQVAAVNGKILGKPHTETKACEQLRLLSGQIVTFYTGLAIATRGGLGELQLQSTSVPFTVHMRELSDAEIVGYVKREQPLQCAGSFKSEALGINLFERFNGDDPNTLIGLPLMLTLKWLRAFGVNPLLD